MGHRRSPTIDQSQAQPNISDTATATSQRGGRAIILVVERDPHIRALETYFLNKAGYAVKFAADGVAALEQAQTGEHRK